MPFLRQSTSQAINFGPFLDSTDGVTPETGLTIAQADRQLSKDGAAYAQSSTTGNATHDTDGHYTSTLSAADTGTLGELKLEVTVAGALPVWEKWAVVSQPWYDAMFGTGTVDVSVTEWDGDAASVKVGATSGLPQVDTAAWADAAVAPASVPGVPEVDLTHWNGLALAGANMIEDDGSGNSRYTTKALERASGGTGGLINLNYRWSTNTAATDPTAGRVKGNNATLGSITEIYVNDLDDNNFNGSFFFSDIEANDIIQIAQESNGANFFRGTASGPATDNGGWWTIPITNDEASGSLVNNTAVRMGIIFQDTTVGGLTEQQVRDAMKLAPTAGAPATGSVDEHLDDIDTSTAGLSGAAMRGTDGASTHSAADVWANPARTVTGGTIDTNNDMRGTDGASTSVELAAVDAKIDAIKTETDKLDAPRGEPGQGAPAASVSMFSKLDFLYKWTRNKKDNDGSTTSFYNDAGGVVDHKQTTSEAAGTVTKDEIVGGP